MQVMGNFANLNEKYTNCCSEKCKLLNAIESVSKESKMIQNEINIILDLISETISGKEFEQLDSESDSEMTFEPFYESFLNSNIRTRELEKVKRIHSEILEKTQKVEKKPKRKFSKKSKEDSVAKSESVNVGEGGSNPSTD